MSDRTILCVTRNVSGRQFMGSALAAGSRVFVLTAEENRGLPCEAPLSGITYLPDLDDWQAVREAVGRLDGGHFDRIVAIAEKDVLNAARLREELDVPGPRLEEARRFRDKLEMRRCCAVAGVRQPAFAAADDAGAIARLLKAHTGAWVLKVRDGVGANDVRRFDDPHALRAALDQLGEKRSRYLLEAYIPGEVFHVDSLVWNGRPVFHNASRYGVPMLKLVTEGGHFVSFNIPRGGELETQLAERNAEVVSALGASYGVTHIELIRGAADGEVYFLEAAARVGAARTPHVIQAARGVNLYHEWAMMEAFSDYAPPEAEDGYAGVILSVATHGPVDTRGYNHPAVVWRSSDPYMPGLMVRHHEPHLVESLLREAYGHFERHRHAPRHG